MTEAEWLACERPGTMLSFLRDRGGETDRKLLLFSVACCRLKLQEEPLPFQERHRRAVETIERYADGLATEKQMHQACNEIPSRAGPRSVLVLEVGRFSAGVGARLAARALAGGGNLSPPACRLLRDLFGNPFRPVSSSPAWLTADVVALATAAYDERVLPSARLDPHRLQVLADALEEAGCTDARVLRHCRGFECCPRCGGEGQTPYDHGYYPPPLETCSDCGGSGWVEAEAPHTRGCWVLDLLTGRG